MRRPTAMRKLRFGRGLVATRRMAQPTSLRSADILRPALATSALRAVGEAPCCSEPFADREVGEVLTWSIQQLVSTFERLPQEQSLTTPSLPAPSPTKVSQAAAHRTKLRTKNENRRSWEVQAKPAPRENPA